MPFLLLTFFLFAGYVNQIYAKDALIINRGIDPLYYDECNFRNVELDVILANTTREAGDLPAAAQQTIATVTIDDVSGNENDGAVIFTATLDFEVIGGFTVDVNTTDGTATTADSDYTAIVGQTLTFVGTAGETQTFTLLPTGDTKLEANETVSISMDNLLPTALSVDITDSADLTITNDDSVSAALSVSTQGNEDAPTDIVYTVTLSSPNNTGSPITFDIDDAGSGTATSGSDYTAIAAAATITVADGSSTGTFTVLVIDDGLLETTETVIATISNPSNGSVSINTASAT
ncbi:Calx-beta domain-containing protein, partial [Ancylomarina sp. YFZ004]